MIRSSVLKDLSDGIEGIDAIQAKTQIEMNLAGYLARIRINWYFEEYLRPNTKACYRAGHYCSLN